MDWRQVDQEIAGRIWTSGLATGVMDEISFQYSPRPTASAPLQQAFAYVGSLLTDLGAVNVHEEAVEMHAWEAAPAEFCVTAPYSRTYPCLQHVHTPSGHASGRHCGAESPCIGGTHHRMCPRAAGHADTCRGCFL